jgi:hypothetical protein
MMDDDEEGLQAMLRRFDIESFILLYKISNYFFNTSCVEASTRRRTTTKWLVSPSD